MIAIYPEALAMRESENGGRAYYSPNEAAERLGVTSGAVYAWIRDGYLKAQKTGPKPKSPWRIPVEEVERMAAKLGL
jgi:excisionase family DNA binding protein